MANEFSGLGQVIETKHPFILWYAKGSSECGQIDVGRSHSF